MTAIGDLERRALFQERQSQEEGDVLAVPSGMQGNPFSNWWAAAGNRQEPVADLSGALGFLLE